MASKRRKRKLLPVFLGYFVAGIIITGIAIKMLFKKLSFNHQGRVEYGKDSNR